MQNRVQKILSSSFFFWITNIFLALFFGRFLLNFIDAFIKTKDWGFFLPIIVQTLIIILFLTRKNTKKISTSFYDWAIGIGGTSASLLFRPVPPSSLLEFGIIIQTAAFMLQIVSLIYLNRSMGVVPANRGLKSSGPYKFVRHPLYATYLISCTGFTLGHPGQPNGFVLLAIYLFEILRIFNEERFLSHDKNYQAYMKKTKWRLIPFVF